MKSSGPKRFENETQAKAYLAYRPVYSPSVMERILELCNQRQFKQSLVVDVGCGSGQSTRYLAPYFDHVIGVDVSENQLKNARSATSEANVLYRIGSAENIPCDDKSVDLVTVATAIHWFNLELFGKEVDRILKPGGCLAVYGYESLYPTHSDKNISKTIADIYFEIKYGILGPYWDHERVKILRNGCSGYRPVYPEVLRDTSFTMKWEITIEQLFGYFRSLSAFQNYLEANPDKEGIFEEYKQRFSDALMPYLTGTGTSADFKFYLEANIYVIVDRKPQP